jgi:hypothetical protein
VCRSLGSSHGCDRISSIEALERGWGFSIFDSRSLATIEREGGRENVTLAPINSILLVANTHTVNFTYQ